jgi:branched-chain amino acid transport system ATP-binding protein
MAKKGGHLKMTMLVVENLSKSFGGLQALKRIDFTVEQGERLVIIGPNGAGKTTLFNMISGTISPTHGRILLLGKDITLKAPHYRAMLGMARTFQITNLFFNLSLYENILLATLGTSSAKFAMHRPLSTSKEVVEKVEHLILEWKLQDHKETLVRNLSYGVQRQLEVIMALAGKTRILLLDEPTAGMSPAETEALTSLILRLDRQMTLIIIEHDMDVAFQLAHRMLVLHHGSVFAQGSPEMVRGNPGVRDIYLGKA